MSIPRNNAAPPPPDATPAAGAPAGWPGPVRRRAVMVGNLLASSGLFFFAACSERGLTQPGAPVAATADRPVPMAAVPSDDGAARAVATPLLGIATTVRGDTLVEAFTYVAGEGLIVKSGRGHKVVMPSNAICDPATAGYGAGVWNKACAPAKSNIRFTMRSWTTPDSVAHVTFSPDVRFAPSATVLLHIVRPPSAGLAGTATPILWCPTGAATCVDESLTDRSVATSFDPYAHSAWRRVKHFSGFNTGFGKTRTRLSGGDD